MAALQTLERIPPANRYPLAGHLLNDPVLAVRSEAARTLVGTPLNQLDVQARGALQRSMRDYFDIQTLNADRPESAFNLANMSAQAGNASQAERYYRESIQRDATFTPAYLNLAELYRNENMNREATAMLRQGLAAGTQDPAALHHALGLAMVRQGATAQALPELRRAAELAPEVPRYPYVLGIALNSTGQSDAAVSVLEKAQQQHPNDRELMFALATMERDRGRQAEARRWTEAILSLNPADEQGKRLLEELQSP
jgi:tetratricopeptide (TPR) repeat protein